MTSFQPIASPKPDVLQIDIVDLQTIVRGELKALREHIAKLVSLDSQEVMALKHKLDEAEDLICWQVDALAQDLEALKANSGAMEVRHA